MKGGDGVASRRTLAVAACMLASGLLVGGSCASLAVADPDSDHGGSGGGGSSGGGSQGGGSNNRPGLGFGFGFGQRPGAPSGAAPGDVPKTIGNQVPDFGLRFPGRPGAVIGDGRNGHTGTVPKAGDTAQSGNDGAQSGSDAAPPSPNSPSGSAEQPVGPIAAAPQPVVIPTPAPVATSTGVTIAPTTDPLAALPVGLPGWWPTTKIPALGSGIPELGSGNPGPTAAAPPLLLPPASPLQLPTALPTALPAVLPTALPTALLPLITPIFDVVTGLATAASQLPFVAVVLPVVVPPAGAAGGATAGGHRVAGGDTPSRPSSGATVGGSPPVTGKAGTPQSPPQDEKPRDFAAGSGLTASGTYRAGYDDYLRAAGVGKVAAVAVPGVSGILLLTGAGGLIGYRQARAGSVARASGPGRFMS